MTEGMTLLLDKGDLLQSIIAKLNHDLDVIFTAARTAHEAATHEENQPDNKYDTLALEASYVAQGQANRASDIRQAIEVYKQLGSLPLDDESIRLTALVTLEAEDGTTKVIFIGPTEGGLKVDVAGTEVVVITPASPLGRELIGKSVGDTVEMTTACYEIVAVC
ncbi:transcription elongation factor GreA [Geobacter sp. OR-1]|uniref:GreA/GreB family elongation factor n=1 Tax=Geobacter sp. OR-1 TaxID=1266765 RepID=UPI000542EC31|nr:GreA/GreB family elongation factor [Geobacter sp. OR-1]GAM09429.1 transcription elongation factor GreA [Geobacter sp. OR-1]